MKTLAISSMGFLYRKFIFGSNEMDSRHVPRTCSIADVDTDGPTNASSPTTPTSPMPPTTTKPASTPPIY